MCMQSVLKITGETRIVGVGIIYTSNNVNVIQLILGSHSDQKLKPEK